MSREDIASSCVSEKRGLYIQKLKKGRKNFYIKVESGSELEKYISDEIEQIIALDTWFLNSCDENEGVKEFLSFYYECIKEGNYIEIAKRIFKDGNEYKRKFSEYFAFETIFNKGYRHSNIYLELSKAASEKNIWNVAIEEHENLEDIQNHIAKALVKSNFHVIIFSLGLTMFRSRPFIRESIIFQDFLVSNDVLENLRLIREFEYLRCHTPGEPHKSLVKFDEKWKIEIEDDTFLVNKEKAPGLDFYQYMNQLTCASCKLSDTLYKSYERKLSAFLSSFWKPEEKAYEIDGKKLIYEKHLIDLYRTEIIEPTRKFFKKIYECSFGPEDQESFVQKDSLIARSETLDHMNNCINEAVVGMTQTGSFGSVPSENDESKTKFTFYQNTPVSIDTLTIFLNPFDEDELRENLRYWKDKGLNVQAHPAIMPGNFLIIPRGTFLLINAVSNFCNNSSNEPKVYSDVTIPILTFGVRCYVVGKNAQPPNYYRKYPYDFWNSLV